MPEIEFEQHKAIYKNSKCYQHVDNFLNTCEYDAAGGEENKFYAPAFAKAFHKNHLSYLLLWGRMVTYLRSPTAPRANNGAIEGYFQQTKKSCREESLKIGAFGMIRCGRYINLCSETVDYKVKLCDFNIPARRLGKSSQTSSSSQSTSSQRLRSSQRSKSSQDMTEADVLYSREKYGKRNARSQAPKTSKFFGRRSASAE